MGGRRGRRYPMSSVGVVLVHYRTPELVRPAVEAFGAELERIGAAARIVLVDNGSEPDSRVLWRDLPIERIEPGRNLGYAGGVNRGIAAVDADRLLVANPDVVLRPGALEPLLDVLERGAAAAGPRFEWDRAGRWWLPPAEERTRRWELLAALAQRSERWAARARRRWRRHARRHWEADRPMASRALSGALLAIRRDAWSRVGPFDEGYHLYFEESDWLARLAAARLPSCYVPAARAWHLYAQSSLRESRSAGWFAEAAARFRERTYGARFARLLARLERAPVAAGHPAPARDEARLAAGELPAATCWLELAMRTCGFPAATERLLHPAGDWSLPDDLRERLPGGSYRLRLVAETGREISSWDYRAPERS